MLAASFWVTRYLPRKDKNPSEWIWREIGALKHLKKSSPE